MWGWLSQNHHGFFQPAKSLDLAQVQASAGAIWDHQWDRLGAQVEEHRHSCSRALAHGIYGTSADRSAVRSDWGHGPKALHHHRWSCHRNAGSHRGQITHWPPTDSGYHLPIIGWSNPVEMKAKLVGSIAASLPVHISTWLPLLPLYAEWNRLHFVISCK